MLSALYPMLVLPTLHSSAFRNALMGPSAQLVSRPATRRSRKRPRGIWKTRKPVAAQAFVERLSHHQRAQHDIDLSEDEAEDAASTSTASSRKRRRTDSHDTSSSEPSVSSASLTSSPATSFYEVPQSQSAMNGVLAIVESKAGKQDCNLTDWEELKALFAEAAERYECDEAPTAMRLLRSVMQECNRFMSVLPNPSVLFVPGAFTPRHGGKDKQRSQDDYFARIRSSTLNTVQTELPTAFHIILGITLFLFGNLVEQDVSLLRPGEPTSSLVYWLAALDVFETAESLPCRTSGSSDAEDWRMAVVWGRTLIRVAEATIYLTRTDPSARLPVHEPKWPSDSIFRAIAAARPPLTRRRSLSIATPNEILILAMDQLSRGIFHMPHPFYRHNAPTAAVATFCASPALKSKHLPQTLTPSTHSSLEFSRPKELFTIASEVLGVAEKLSSLSDRRYWALWADTVFEQMKMEAADAVIWRGRIAGLRGKCWLVAASVWIDPIEEALERGDVGVLDNTDAVVSRDGYQKAVDFFEQSKTCGVLDAEIQPMFVEALLSLANLTPDEAAREELYARAEAEGGDFMLDNTIDKS